MSKKKSVAGTWTKEVICLKDCYQDTAPTTEEKMELARMNLGLRKLVFSAEGDASHIHDVILDAYPVIEDCGGYTLLRVSDNSKNLIEIEGPQDGLNVPFLKDILRQAKMYVRPLQVDIPEQKMNKKEEEVIGVYSIFIVA